MTNYIQQSRSTESSAVIYDVNNQISGNNAGAGDGDSWFVSYADILLLLLTFFVLLFAFSRVEGVGANEEIAEDADRVMASSMEQNEKADVLVAEVVADDTMLTKVKEPLSNNNVQVSSLSVAMGEGSVSVIHELVADEESVAVNDGVKIDALIDESMHYKKAPLENIAQNESDVTDIKTVKITETVLVDTKPIDSTIEKNENLIDSELAMYETEFTQDNDSEDALNQNVSNTDANLQVEENVVALTVDEQLAKLSAGLTSSEVEVSSGYQSINIELNNKILFSLGEAKLLEEGEVFLNEIATIMESNEYFASVEGHTDDTPIATSQFPSNWELSSSRATSVARYLISQGVAANRLRAIGYADTKPKVENVSDDDRARNRRVSITFHYDSDAPLS